MTNESENKTPVVKCRGLLINLLLFFAVIAAVRAWQQRDMVSGTAPALQGITLAGQPYKLPLHPAQPMLVHFWATWCPICRTEQGSITSIAQDDPNVITISMQSGKQEDVARYMHEQGTDFPVINDPDGSLSSAWGVHAVPASFIIAPDGRIRFVEVGYTTGIGLRFRMWMAGV
jgi:peroxiredoxin